MGKDYGRDRLEAACRRAIQNVLSYSLMMSSRWLSSRDG
ncbi:hypothetical protein P3T25_003396 [Paraburkholderia sp. GAS32]|jgi:hypothetical protein